MTRAIGLGLAGCIGFLLALEMIFQILPVSSSTETGYYTDPKILTYPPNHKWIMSTGWDLRNAQTLKANNLGYPASRDFERNDRAVGLIGDSFVESSMLTAADRPGAQLERLLVSRPVFAMGGPGTALLDYAERVRFAHQNLGVRDFVILMERGDVKQSLCGSGNINGPCLDAKTFEPRTETHSAPGFAKRIFRHSALAQYVFSQLRFTPQRVWQQARTPMHTANTALAVLGLEGDKTGSNHPPAATAPYVDVVVTTFFDRVKPHVQGKLLIIIDSDRTALYSGKSLPDPARTRFIQLAQSRGAVVIDTEPLFRAHLAQSKLKIDVSPNDGHLNEIGINIVMQAAVAALSGN